MSVNIPASFIEEISENGTKEEAIACLQETWNEKCELEYQVSELKKAIRKIQFAMQGAADAIRKYNGEGAK